MRKKVKLNIIHLIFFAIILYVTNIYSQPNDFKKPLKLAVIDGLANIKEFYASEQYKQSYLGGISIGIDEARKMGILIEPNFIFYHAKKLDIFRILPDVIKYDPDFIIGPRWSDQFLLLNGNFQKKLVISPFATADEVYEMPKNFYTLGVPNKILANYFYSFIQENFKKKPFIIVQADCKNCVSISEKLNIMYGNEVATSYFLEKSAENTSLDKLLKGYLPNTPIILLCTGYSAGIMMARIPDMLKQNNTVFIGGDDWGSWKAWDTGKVKSHYSYLGYHITPWSLDSEDKDVINFKKSFIKKYHFEPDNIAFVTYSTVISVAKALVQYPSEENNSDKMILNSYQSALNNNKNWFRPNKFSIYKVTEKGEIFWKTASIKTKN